MRIAASKNISTGIIGKKMNEHGYSQSKAVLGLWTHKTRPILFTLIVDDFGVKYVGKEHAMHLLSILKQHYEISEDWTGSKYFGITFEWDYRNCRVHPSMPGYISMALQGFRHERPCRLQNSPPPHVTPWTRRGRNSSKASPVHCCIIVKQWIPLCLLH